MYRITVESFLDDGTPVAMTRLGFDADENFDSLVSKLKRLVNQLVRKEEADEQVHDRA